MAQLALKHRLPATSIFREFAEAGGAIGYGPDQPAYVERVAEQVAKILAGAKPEELPIQRPSKFEFIVNLKTLKALGLSVPDSVLLRADEVIR
jgi:putative ABC transport system substrate-binding protein